MNGATRPASRPLGTLGETSTTGSSFPVGSITHPIEHVLQLSRSHSFGLDTVIDAQTSPRVEAHADFVIRPWVRADRRRSRSAKTRENGRGNSTHGSIRLRTSAAPRYRARRRPRGQDLAAFSSRRRPRTPRALPKERP